MNWFFYGAVVPPAVEFSGEAMLMGLTVVTLSGVVYLLWVALSAFIRDHQPAARMVPVLSVICGTCARSRPIVGRTS